MSLTGHISSVRALAVSSRQPYLFSCGEDKQVKCWDLEMNKVIFISLFEYTVTYNVLQVIRHYHGHLSGVYDLSLHPTIDILVTCGRDASARVSYGIVFAAILTNHVIRYGTCGLKHVYIH